MFRFFSHRIFLRKWILWCICAMVCVIFGAWYFVSCYLVHSFELVNRSSHRLFHVRIVWPDGSWTSKGAVDAQDTTSATHRPDRDGCTQLYFDIIDVSGETRSFHYVVEDYMTQNIRSFGTFEVNDAILSQIDDGSHE